MAMYEQFNKRLGIKGWYNSNKETIIAGAVTALAGISLVALSYATIKSTNIDFQKQIPKLERTTQKFNTSDNTKSLETIFNSEK